ncbi:MAG: glycine--tRNA ligase [Bacteroidota bacterium]
MCTTLPESVSLPTVIAHAKEYGFLYPSSEIYEGLQAVYDYGPYGAALKRNIKSLWWKSMTQLYQNIVGIDTAIFMHPKTWVASGHVANFSDPMIDNKDSQKRYRVDLMIEAHAAQLTQQGQAKEAEALLQAMHGLLHAQDLDGLYQLIISAGILCPVAKTNNWTAVRQFNLMFATQAGALEESAEKLYLRPETAQGIFVNFLNVQKSARMKVPFGIAQIGKAFRNEIVARQFIFRMREFEQMEMQFFVRPGTESYWFDYWQEQRLQWHLALGIPKAQLHLHPHEQLAHYAQTATDIEYAFPFGFKEIEGIHSRTDFDLKNHQNYAKKKLQYFDPEIKQSYIPYVIETSLGCDRLVLALLCQGLIQEPLKEDNASKTRTYLKLPPALAPIKVAILPLVKKDGLPESAKKLAETLRIDFSLAYEENQSIGKRYARQDLIGTPYCVTVDHQSLEDDTITLRERDSMQQQRLPIQALRNYLSESVTLHTILKKLAHI